MRIHQVAALTGVPEPTLRAWERRYGVPSPRRTASGYRLYGPTEIEQVREMRRLCEVEGMAASEAARVVLEQKVPAREEARDPYAELADRLVAAAIEYDAAGLDDLAHRLLFMGSATTMIDRVVAPALRAVGEKWHAGEIDVGQEHFFSQRMGTFLRDVAQIARVEGGPKVLLACAEDERHELGLLALSCRFSSWGYEPIYLGTETPPSAVRNAVENVHPKLVALSMTIVPAAPRARALLGDYKAACGAVPLIVGGAAARALEVHVGRVGAALAPEDPSALRSLVRNIIDKQNKRRTK